MGQRSRKKPLHFGVGPDQGMDTGNVSLFDATLHFLHFSEA